MSIDTRGEKSNNPDFPNVMTKFDLRLSFLHNQITGVHGHFAPFSMRRVIRMIEKFQPDIIQLYNLHGYYVDIYRLFDYLKEKHLPIVYGMLDEHPYLGYCMYAYDCDQYITGCRNCDWKRFRREYPRNLFRNGSEKTVALKQRAYADYSDKLIFTAPKWVLERAEKSYLLKEMNLKEVDEFVDTDKIFYPRATDGLKEELGIPKDAFVVLNVAPSNDPRKGVRYYVELAKQFGHAHPEYVFVHVGYQGRIEGLPSNFIPISFVRDQGRLAQFYSMADVFVCTSLADTMPNTCLDALSCGTPILGFDITGVPYVAEAPLGYFVEAGNISELGKALLVKEKKTQEVVEQCREYAVKRYSPETYYKKMIKIYEDLLG